MHRSILPLTHSTPAACTQLFTFFPSLSSNTHNCAPVVLQYCPSVCTIPAATGRNQTERLPSTNQAGHNLYTATQCLLYQCFCWLGQHISLFGKSDLWAKMWRGCSGIRLSWGCAARPPYIRISWSATDPPLTCLLLQQTPQMCLLVAAHFMYNRPKANCHSFTAR